MGLSSALKGKKYKESVSYDYVKPEFSYYEQNIPDIYRQAAEAPEVTLNINSYTPYGKIQDVRDTGKGYNEYDLREVLDPTFTYKNKSYTGDDSWKYDIYNDIATGNVTGITDLASDWVRLQDMKRLGHMTETENLADEITKAYYTPYEMALGMHTGQGTDIGFDPSRGIKGTKFNTSGQRKKVGSRHKETHYFDPDWSAVRRYDLENAGPLLKTSMDLMPTLQDEEGWDWEDNTLYDPSYGFFTQEAGKDDYDYERKHGSKTKSYRKGGLASKLGPLGTILSFIPALQPIGMALSAANAVINKNPLALLASGIGYLAPGIGDTFASADAAQLASQGISGSQLANTLDMAHNLGTVGSTALGGLAQSGITMAPVQQAVFNAAKSGLGSAITGGDVGQSMLSGGLSAGVGSALNGTEYYSGVGSKYVNPAISKAMTSAAVNGLMGNNVKEAMKQSLLKSAWNSGGKIAGNQFKGLMK